ncbi:MAG TPA: branched-chain amino acid ABC transporter permease [Actinomycetota bacterium]|nr:branched-chain amino acid ABC transporter permease [Actinomycetota bacterium]
MSLLAADGGYYVQQVINAISLGGLYALLTLGLAIVFNILGLINFAYGELVAIGGYAIYLALNRGVPWAAVVAGTILVVSLSAVLMERVGFRPYRGAGPVTLLITSFALSSMLQNGFLIAISPRAQGVATPGWTSDVIHVGPYEVPVIRLITIGVTFACLIALLVFLRRFDMGLAMRAASEDFQAVRLMGIRANRVVAVAFLISGALAGVSALLVVAQTGVVEPTMGLPLLISAFIASVLGGLGNLSGAVVGAFLLAALQVGFQVVLPEGLLAFRDAFTFGVVAVILLLRPTGLLGRAREGV